MCVDYQTFEQYSSGIQTLLSRLKKVVCLVFGNFDETLLELNTAISISVA